MKNEVNILISSGKVTISFERSEKTKSTFKEYVDNLNDNAKGNPYGYTEEHFLDDIFENEDEEENWIETLDNLSDK